MEIWKDILECKGYQVSNHGRIMKLKGSKILTPVVCNKWGHSQVRITIKGECFRMLTHRLVAMYFIPNPLNLPVVNHIDTDPTNNRASNLEWCTQSHNMLHSVNRGAFIKCLGSRNHKASITESDAKKIFDLSKELKIKEVSRITGFAPTIIHKIKNGYAWNQVTGLPRKRYNSKSKAA